MCRTLAILAGIFCITSPAFSQAVVFPDNTTSDQPGGLMFIRKGNQTTWSVGGVFLSRHVKIVTRTPEGKEITRFKLPSVFQDPYTPPLSELVPALVHVNIPDVHGNIYIDGELVRTSGTSRRFESPSLPAGKSHPVLVRAVFAVGNELLIEDKEIVLRAGESIAVTFDGSRAVRVPLRPESAKVARP